MTNHFSNVVTQVKQTPKDQRIDTLVQGIVHQLEQSGNAETIQFGQELQQLKGQLVNALNGS